MNLFAGEQLFHRWLENTSHFLLKMGAKIYLRILEKERQQAALPATGSYSSKVDIGWVLSLGSVGYGQHDHLQRPIISYSIVNSEKIISCRHGLTIS